MAMLRFHDLGVVKQVADKVCVMKDGEIVEIGQPEHIYETRAPLYENAG